MVAGARRTEEFAPLVAQYGERVKPVTLEVCCLEPGGIRTDWGTARKTEGAGAYAGV
jgi:hypothetical protein